VKSLERLNFAGNSNPKTNGNGGGWKLNTAADSFESDFVIVANGAKSSLTESLASNFSICDYSSAMGYHLPLQEDFIRFQFLEQFKGYLWTFPRPDHVSVGICSKLSEHTASELKVLLHEFAERVY
jgi:flavin-dependent dehydrogenase